MPWFRVEGKLAWHPKVVRAGNAAIGAWVRLGSWCADMRTDGKVPKAMAGAIGLPSEIAELVEVGLLEVDGVDYLVHDYLDYNMSAAEDDERKAEISRKRSEAGKKGAAARWGTRSTSDGKSHGKSYGKRDGPSQGKSHGKDVASRWPDPDPYTDPDHRSPDADGDRARSREPAPATGECDGPEATAILAKLAELAELRDVATPAFGNSLSAFALSSGQPLPRVLKSLEQGADKLRDQVAVGDGPSTKRELAAFVKGCVRRGPIRYESDRQREAELEAAAPPKAGWADDDAERPPLPPVMRQHLERTGQADAEPSDQVDGLAAIAELAKAKEA